MSRWKKVAVIGGGTGSFVVLSALKKYPLDLSAIVSMTDSGGSTGRLRDELGVLPPGDIRQALVALAQTPRLRDLFNYRFKNGSLLGHSFGNIFLAALEKLTGNFKEAVLEASKILNIKGKVIPVTVDKVNLYAKLTNEEIIVGEDKIEQLERKKETVKIQNVYLKPRGKITEEAREAILKAQTIIVGPGDIYTSLISNLLVVGVREAISQSKATVIYLCNLMTKHGQTDNFRVSDFVKIMLKYLPRIDFVIYNTQRPSSTILEKYKRKKEYFVEPDKENFLPGIKFIERNLLNSKIIQPIKGDLLARSLIRHEVKKLVGKVLFEIIASS
jgi:uncharacterized cofD-like protein